MEEPVPEPITSRLVVRSAGEAWQPASRSGFLSEAELQALFVEQPSLVPDVSPQAVAVSEFSTDVGPSDVVIVDQDGSLTVVECKLATNVEIRRKIVGQVLDYAANLWRMPLADFEQRWLNRSKSSLVEQLTDDARATLQQSLYDGTFTLVLAVDRINDDLRRIVEYLNAHTGDTIRVLAMELGHAEHGGVEMLIPTVYGAEIADSKSRETTGSSRWSRTQWEPAQVIAKVAESDGVLGAALAEFLDELRHAGFTVTGTRAKEPSLVVGADVAGGQVWPFSLYTGESESKQFAVNYAWLRPLDAARRERFLEATGIALPTIDREVVASAEFRKRPGAPLSAIRTPEVRSALVAAARELIRS